MWNQVLVSKYLKGGQERGTISTRYVLEYSDTEGDEKKWTKVGEMSEPRRHHGVSIVDYDNFKIFCQ